MTNKIKLIMLIGLLFAISADAYAKKYCVAPTPPMGWNSWNRFGHNINEQLIMEIADAMVSSGMKDAGFRYIVIDDVWHLGRTPVKGWEFQGTTHIEGRDANGVLIPDPNKFPNGIKYVADYVHSKGLKFGLYTVPGLRTCAGCPGSQGYEELDLKTFASWGVDYIKLDGCGVQGDTKEILTKWRTLIDKLDRPIVLSLNLGVSDFNPQLVDMWRTTTDIMPVWSYKPEEFRLMASISDIIDLQAGLEYLHGNCAWNDPDMLQVGNSNPNGNITDDENKAHFSIWCIFGAPLMAGNDLRTMSEATRTVLTNKEAIAIDQDAAGNMGRLVKSYKPGLQVWGKKLQEYGAVAVVLLNRTEQEAEIKANLADLGIKGEVFVRDLWQHKDIGLFSKEFSAKVPSHGAVMVKMTAFEHLGEFASRPEMPQSGIVIEPENEEQYFGGGKVGHDANDFTGTGYVVGVNDLWRPLELIIVTPVAKRGKYQLEIRYSNPNPKALKYNIWGRGISGAQIDLQPTKNISDWQIITVDIQMSDGINQITIIAPDSKSNEVLIDNVKIVPKKE
jgi:alpha-galactosidase